jgi:hypothetical protein
MSVVDVIGHKRHLNAISRWMVDADSFSSIHAKPSVGMYLSGVSAISHARDN